MKTVYVMVILLYMGQGATAQDSSASYGWLKPGHSWFEFSHRLATPANTPRVVDRFYRGKFIFGWYKPIFTRPHWQLEISMMPQLLYGGFNERRILLPAFNFRGEITWRFHWDQWVDLVISNLHYSTHLMDKLPITTPEQAAELKTAHLAIDDVNLLRLGVCWRTESIGPIDAISGVTGLQPIRMNYWLITEANLAFRKASYQSYDRRGYTEIVGHSKIGTSRLLVKFAGEFWETARVAIEFRYSTQIASQPNWDGLQLYVTYEGGKIQANEVAITPHSGISRNWLIAGIRIIN